MHPFPQACSGSSAPGAVGLGGAAGENGNHQCPTGPTLEWAEKQTHDSHHSPHTGSPPRAESLLRSSVGGDPLHLCVWVLVSAPLLGR